MTIWHKVQGDVNDTLTTVLSGVEDLNSAVAVEAHVWRRRGQSLETLPATITDPTDRIVSVDLGGTTGWLSDAAPASWRFDVEVTFGDGTVLTWPSQGDDIIEVRSNT